MYLYRHKITAMKKVFLNFIFSLFTILSTQAQAYEGAIQYDKKKQQAILIDYSYSSEAVQNAITGKLAKMGYKPKEEKGIFNKDKGFLVYKNTYINDISTERMDYIINVERRSRKEKDEAILYLILSRDGNNLFSKVDIAVISNAKTFLNNLLPEVEAADLELKIKAQEEVVAKAEKKLRDLKDDQSNLEKKLTQNKKDQEDTQKDIEAQKQALGILVGKRKSN
jgi:hypothetical protein